MLDGINPQAAAFTANQFHDQASRSAPVTSNSEHEEKVTNTRQVRTMPGQDEVGPDGLKRDSFELSKEAEEIRQLQARDREVRAHEAAHAAAGGAHAGAPSYTFEHGPDGQSYAVGGEVSINVSPVAGDPEATLQKAKQVRAAALAPAEPSAQDMKVAQRAQAMAAKARMEVADGMAEKLKTVGQKTTITGSKEAEGNEVTTDKATEQPDQRSVIDNIPSGFARLSVHA